ncbi:hypothetical protein HOE07_00930 [archaeon]|nr:hypothetical protein [archaeon]
MKLTLLELRRQLLHMFFGLFLVAMLYFEIFNLYWMVGILGAGVVLSELCKRGRVPLASWVMDHFERDENRKAFPGRGPIFFMIGSIIVLWLFSKDVALASMVILAVGDAVSHIFGKLLSKKKYKYLKSVKGTLIGVGCGILGAFIFVSIIPAVVGGAVSMLFEGLDLGLEDNLYIPIVAAIAISLVI